MTEADLRIDTLKREWTDQYVVVNTAQPELQRFVGVVGRVVTVNWNGKAVIDFQDGAWYDIPASADFLTRADKSAADRFNAKANSAQRFPARKG
jgi:hypothetical protein